MKRKTEALAIEPPKSVSVDDSSDNKHVTLLEYFDHVMSLP